MKRTVDTAPHRAVTVGEIHVARAHGYSIEEQRAGEPLDARPDRLTVALAAAVARVCCAPVAWVQAEGEAQHRFVLVRYVLAGSEAAEAGASVLGAYVEGKRRDGLTVVVAPQLGGRPIYEAEVRRFQRARLRQAGDTPALWYSRVEDVAGRVAAVLGRLGLLPCEVALVLTWMDTALAYGGVG